VEFYTPSWEDIEIEVLNLGKRILENNFRPSVIIAILTGGVIPGKLLLDILGVEKMRYVEIKFYKGIGETNRRPVIKAIYAENIENEEVLIVDAVSDTGETLEAVVNVMSMYRPRRIRTSTIFVKPWSKKIPDYYSKVVDKWIVFPWDKWELFRERQDIPLNEMLKRKYLEGIMPYLRRT